MKKLILAVVLLLSAVVLSKPAGAYKDLDAVMAAQLSIHTLKAVLTVKG
jgi:hypothetical protein